jgi:hypothetical protein
LKLSILAFLILTTISCSRGRAKNNGSADAGTCSPAQSDALTFESDIFPIVEKNCSGCHGADQPRAGLNSQWLISK